MWRAGTWQRPLKIISVTTHVLHVHTTLEAFAETLDMDSLAPMSKLAWRSLQEAVALMDSAACTI